MPAAAAAVSRSLTRPLTANTRQPRDVAAVVAPKRRRRRTSMDLANSSPFLFSPHPRVFVVKRWNTYR